MPRFVIRVEVDAVRAEKDAVIVHDGGKLRIKAGQWLVVGSAYGPAVMTDAEVTKLPRMLSDSVAEKELQQALETGTL